MGDYLHELQIGQRTIRLKRFWSESTYGGIYEGDPTIIQQPLRERLEQDFRRLCGDTGPLVWLVPPPGDMPNYRCAAYLDSLGPTRGNAGDVSFLTVGWLVDSLEVSLSDMLRIALTDVDWERRAQSMTWVDYC